MAGKLLNCPGRHSIQYFSNQLTYITVVRPYPVSIILALHDIVGVILLGYIIVRIDYDLCDMSHVSKKRKFLFLLLVHFR